MKVITKRTGIEKMQSKSGDLMPFLLLIFQRKQKFLRGATEIFENSEMNSLN